MKLFKGLLLAATLFTSAAHADGTAAPMDGTKFLAWFDKLADGVVADQNDCTKMAADLNKSVDDNKDMIDAAKKAQASGQHLSQDQAQHLMASAKRIANAMVVKCSKDADVQAAMKRLPGPPHK